MKILCQRSTTIGVYQLIEFGNGIFCYGTSEQIKDLRNYLRIILYI